MVSVRDAELAILNAPFDNRGWELATQKIAAATFSSGAHLLGMGGPLLFPLNTVVGNYAGYEAYFDDPSLHGQCNWRIGTAARVLEIHHEAHHAAYRDLYDTSDYDDAVSDLNIPYGCQSALLLDSNNLLGIALLRSRRDGPCDHAVLQRFAVLRRQLARAVRMQIALDGEAADLMVGDLGMVSGATMLLDRHGSLCAHTEAADALFEGDGPLLLDGLSIRLRDRGEDRLLQSAFGRLLRSDGYKERMVHTCRIGRSEQECAPGWTLCAVRLPNREHGLGFEPNLAITVKRAA